MIIPCVPRLGSLMGVVKTYSGERVWLVFQVGHLRQSLIGVRRGSKDRMTIDAFGR